MKIKAKCPVCGWKGESTNGICPNCLGPLIAIEVTGKVGK